MKRWGIWLGLAGAALIAAMMLLPQMPARMVATAPMGSTLTVTIPRDGVASVYSTHRYWDFDCTITTADGRAGMLRSDMLSQNLPGGWYPRGEIADTGRLTITCGQSGGMFGVGPTRGARFVLLRAALLVAGAGLVIAVVVVALVRWSRRRRSRGPARRAGRARSAQESVGPRPAERHPNRDHHQHGGDADAHP